MSEFHGGFFLSRADPGVQEPVLRAVGGYLSRVRLASKGLAVSFATRRGCPVLHCAIRGGEADGKGYCTFHYRHAALGGELARAVGAVVWAYSYENQTGSELCVGFEADGRESLREDRSWDDLADELGLDDSDGSHARLMGLLPLGRLATELGVPRRLLDMDLAYVTPGCSTPLEGPVDPAALAVYLAGDLRDMPEQPRVEAGASQSFFFPSGVLREAERLAERLGVGLGTLLWAAWEHAKPAVHASTRGLDENGNDCGPLPVPAAAPPPGLVVPPEAPDLGSASPSGEPVKVSLALPPRVVEEVKALAFHCDRSMSWVLQRAYSIARSRLHGARRA